MFLLFESFTIHRLSVTFPKLRQFSTKHVLSVKLAQQCRNVPAMNARPLALI